jgi:hypothetical protein
MTVPSICMEQQQGYQGVKGLSDRILLFILLNSSVMKPHKTKGASFDS